MSYFSPDAIIAPLAQSLRHVQFPIERAELLHDYGHIQVQLDQGHILTLDMLLADIAQPVFRSLSDLSVAIGEFHRTTKP